MTVNVTNRHSSSAKTTQKCKTAPASLRIKFRKQYQRLIIADIEVILIGYWSSVRVCFVTSPFHNLHELYGQAQSNR